MLHFIAIKTILSMLRENSRKYIKIPENSKLSLSNYNLLEKGKICLFSWIKYFSGTCHFPGDWSKQCSIFPSLWRVITKWWEFHGIFSFYITTNILWSYNIVGLWRHRPQTERFPFNQFCSVIGRKNFAGFNKKLHFLSYFDGFMFFDSSQ